MHILSLQNKIVVIIGTQKCIAYAIPITQFKINQPLASAYIRVRRPRKVELDDAEDGDDEESAEKKKIELN